jgi:hypothetical protein
MTSVSPEVAALAMATIWENYGNYTSPALLETWRAMCRAFNACGSSAKRSSIDVLAMPTGIGKTTFAALYCSMLEETAPTLPLTLHPGVLFVTRFRKETDSFAEMVNRLAKKPIAIAFHRTPGRSLDEVAHYPVLAVTHSLSESRQMMDSALADTDPVWGKILRWQQDQRGKIIIDETPKFVRSASISTQGISLLDGLCSNLYGAPKALYDPLKSLLSVLSDSFAVDHHDRNLSAGEWGMLSSIDVSAMLARLDATPDCELQFDSNKSRPAGEVRSQCSTWLRELGRIQRNGFAWVTKCGLRIVLHSAQLHPSLKAGGCVVLDGTAAKYSAYELFGKRLNLVAPAIGVRNYERVTLYASRGHKVGKEHLTEHVDDVWPKFTLAIDRILPRSARLLVCCHKDVEAKLLATPTISEGTTLAHWGDIDGKNLWREYDSIAILGLPYLDSSVPIDTALATLGIQSDAWFADPSLRKFGNHGDVAAAINVGHICASVVQAINRIRCRGSIDAAGNCMPVSAFILLPSGALGDAVLDAIRDLMPGVRVADWQVDTSVRKGRNVPTVETIIEHLRTAPNGTYTKVDVLDATGIAKASLDRAIQRFRSSTSIEYARLRAIGVTYTTSPNRGVLSCFTKSWAQVQGT